MPEVVSHLLEKLVQSFIMASGHIFTYKVQFLKLNLSFHTLCVPKLVTNGFGIDQFEDRFNWFGIDSVLCFVCGLTEAPFS
jgi:hypothetical protein